MTAFLKTAQFDDVSRTLIAEFILETENRLRRETRPKTENSSHDMHLVKDEFPVLNLSVLFPV